MDRVPGLLQDLRDDLASGHFTLFWGEESFSFDAAGREGYWPATVHSPPPDRLYVVQTHGTEGAEAAYYAGSLPDGSQALLGPYDDGEEVLLARFGPSGELAEAVSRPVEPGQEAWRQALAWQAELGWRPGPVRVRVFMAPEHWAYLAEAPKEGLIAKYDPYYYPDPAVRARARADLAEWEAAGNFVLWWWANNYYLGPDGKVLPEDPDTD
jgi:hypothetical protein